MGSTESDVRRSIRYLLFVICYLLPDPWALYGDNNTFVILRRQSNERFARGTLLRTRVHRLAVDKSWNFY